MDFSDDDVSASGDELEPQENDDVELEQADSDEAGSDSDDADMPQAQVATVTAAGATPATGRQEVQAAQDALLGGEISTNAALLQLQVRCCCYEDDAVASGLKLHVHFVGSSLL
jgi:hypothetical protein